MIKEVLLLSILCFIKCITGQELKNHLDAYPNGTYHISWTVDEENITFQLEVATKGYVGFGFSPDGKMPGADVIIGWVYPNGTSIFRDRHAEGFFEPAIDSEQNYQLLNAFENDTHTVLRFTRKLNTCDKGNDSIITDDTTRIIFSWHPDDPQNITGLPYHGNNRRGSKSILLLSKPPELVQVTDDITVWQVNMPNVTIPAKLTTYYAITVKLPPLTGPHDYIGFTMDITPGNENIVHHLLFFECFGNATYFEEQVAKTKISPVETTIAGTLAPPDECQPPIIAWAVGSPGQKLPDNVGIPVGEENDGTNYYHLEIHYNNVGVKAGILDNSGMRIFLTNKTRPIRGALMQIYANVDYTIVIPPKQPSFSVTAYCPPECTSKAIPKEGITVFAVGLHAHLAGRKISLRHFRNNIEQKPIAMDDRYDFNYQEFRQLTNPVTILPGDTLMAICGYSTTDRNDTIVGGFSTTDEMCFIYMMYYPAVPLSLCIGGPTFKNIYDFFGVETGQDEVHIVTPGPFQNKTIFEYIKQYNWDNAGDAKLKQMYSMQFENEKYVTCLSGRGTADAVTANISYPANATFYKEKDTCDMVPSSTSTTAVRTRASTPL